MVRWTACAGSSPARSDRKLALVAATALERQAILWIIVRLDQLPISALVILSDSFLGLRR